MATNAKEEIKIEAPKETVEMAATPAPAVQAPTVTRDEAYANAVDVSKRTDANGVITPAPVTPAPVAWTPAPVQAPTDYKWNPETQKYDAQPQTPAPVATAPKVETPKPVKTEAPIDYNVSTGREAEIQKNLSDITATNPALTQDRAKFDAAFGYSTADAGKKALLDSFFDSKRAKSQDDFLGILNSGRTVSEDLKGSPEYKMAKSRFDAVQNYKSFTVPQFSSAIASGSLIPGSQAYKDLMSNPESASNIRKAQALNLLNKKTSSEEGKREAVMWEINATTFGQAVADWFIDPKEADALMTTPEITAQNAKIEPLKNKYDALKADYDNIETDTKNEFEASGKSRAYINAKISERRKNLYRDLSVLESQYNNAVGTLADLKKTQAEVLSFNKDLWSAERGFEKQKELAQFQSDLSVSSEAKKFEQKMAQQAAVAKDPTLATQAVLDQYREMGVLAQRSDAEILADVQSQVAGGKPLGQVLTDLNNAFQSKSEYKSAIAKKFPTEGTDWEIVNVTKDGVARSVERNKSTGEIREIGSGSATPSATDYGLPAGSFTDLTSTLKRTGNNVGKDTNNPGNIMAESPKWIEYAKSLGAIGSYKSPNGRTYAVFPDMETGKAATMADLKTKLSGGSSWVTPNTTLGQFATGWTVWPKAGYNASAANSYAKLSGFSPNTRIKDIPLETLANAVIRHEGVDPNVSADIGTAIKATVPEFAQRFLGAVQRGEFTVEQAKGASKAMEFSPSQKSAMANYAEKPSKDTRAELKAQGVTEAQANSYVAALSGEISPVAQSIADGYGNVADLTATEKAKVIPQVKKLVQAKLTGDEWRDAVVKSAMFNKDVSDTTLTKLADMKTVAMQLDQLESRLKGMDTWLIIGEISKMNPYDTEAQVALAQMAGITPKVARGIFGEVGVLTDADLANYQRTLPNLTSTAEKNALVVQFMRKLLSEGVKNTIETQARGQRNVSEYLSEYDKARKAMDGTKQPVSKQSYDALVAKWGEAKTKAYLNAKWFTYNQ